MRGDLRGEQYIDSRDVIARVSELEEEREAAIEDCDHGAECKAQEQHGRDWDATDEGEELAALRELVSEAENSAGDWGHGAQLIRDDCFEDYARELAEDLHGGMRDSSWPFDCIDWERAADALKQDYSSVTFDGEYWVRS